MLRDTGGDTSVSAACHLGQTNRSRQSVLTCLRGAEATVGTDSGVPSRDMVVRDLNPPVATEPVPWGMSSPAVANLERRGASVSLIEEAGSIPGEDCGGVADITGW